MHKTMKHYAKALLQFTTVLLLTTSCGQGPSEKKGIPKEKLDQLKAENKELKKFKAIHDFKEGLGKWELIEGNEKRVLSSQFFGKDFQARIMPFANFEELNEAARKFFYKDGDTAKEKAATGALAMFCYPFMDQLFGGTIPNSPKYLSLARIILECHEALMALTGKPESYTSAKLDEVLSNIQKAMEQAPMLKIEYVTFTDGKNYYCLREKGDGSTENYYTEPGVKEAFEAYKKEVKKLQKAYEKGISLIKTADKD